MKTNRLTEQLLSHERLLYLLKYNPETGAFIRRVPVANQRAGIEAGSFHRYCNICIDRMHYAAHRLAFFYMTKKWPENEVDHVDGKILNNQWSNLRDVTKSENQHNRPKQKNNKSGFKGVYWNSFAKKWTARICINRTLEHLGYFHSAIDAHLAYENKAMSIFNNRKTEA